MDRLRRWSNKAIKRIDTSFRRYLSEEINWDNRLIIIFGARGVGKTTLILQYLNIQKFKEEERIYVSLDDVYFSTHSLLDFVEGFSNEGGKYLFLDEIQKYNNWSIEIKNIYDNYPDLKMVLSGSSAIEILQSEGDLSRRALFYKLNGLSLREYINYTSKSNFRVHSFEEILKNHLEISLEISEQIKPLKEFKTYSKYGYYPFFKEDLETYHKRLGQIINTVVEVDIPAVFTVDNNAMENIKKLLGIVAEMVPFKPNIKKLSEQIGISRESLKKYLRLLEKAEVLSLLYSSSKGVSFLNKPEKIYLNNSNLSYALSSSMNIGNIREGFIANQLSLNHKIRFSENGDFQIDDKFVLEIGGKNKGFKQIKGIDNAWIVADDLEISSGKKIPLWLFGFTY